MPTTRIRCLLAITLLAALPLSTDAAPPNGVLEGTQLLDGYTHEPLQGIDSIVGKITRKDGFEIFYEKGSIPDPNAQFRLGGQFSDRAQGTPEAQRAWYREQMVNGVPVHICMRKDASITVTYPKSGINFSAKIAEPSDLGDVLLMLLTFPRTAEKAGR